MSKTSSATSEKPSATELVNRSCPICEASCGLTLEVDRDAGRVVSIRGDEEDPRSAGFLCPKAYAIKEVYEDPDRIRRPLRRTATGWEEIGWDDALELVGTRLREVRERHGKDAIATYIGNPTGVNLGAMLYTSFFIQMLDSERLFTGATVDQFPKNVSCRLMYGESWMFPIPDLDRSDFFLVLGANPVASNGSLMSAPNMKARLRAHRERGGKLVVVDPRRSETAELADEHLFIKPGSDAFFLFALVNVLFAEDLVAPGRLAEFTDGIDTVRELAGPFTPEAVATATGIDPSTAPNALPMAKLQVLSGAFAGRELELTKALTTLGRPGVQVAAITRRAEGYYIVHVESGEEGDFPLVNGQPIGAKARRLTDNDVVQLAGVKMGFFKS